MRFSSVSLATAANVAWLSRPLESSALMQSLRSRVELIVCCMDGISLSSKQCHTAAPDRCTASSHMVVSGSPRVRAFLALCAVAFCSAGPWPNGRWRAPILPCLSAPGLLQARLDIHPASLYLSASDLLVTPLFP